jgi:hypothetical protein
VKRVVATLAAAALLAGAAEAVAATVSDGDDTPVLLDLKTVALVSAKGKRVEATLTTYEAWTPALLAAAGGGPPGSLCVIVWTKRPVTGVADYLVCAAPVGDGSKLSGSVLREGTKGGLPRKVASAVVTRPNSRSARLSFTLASIGSPASLRFAGEGTQFAGCPPATGCVDRAPNRRGTAAFTPAS